VGRQEVTGLDTNVLARFLLDDDAAQSARARRAIQDGDAFYVDSAVLCELVWVLERRYHLPKAAVADSLDKVLRAGKFVIERGELARLALDDYRAGLGDFADALIAQAALDAGCDAVLTFDKGLKRLPGFRQL
jgi:predicted nucleic-acid-binding protein